MALREQVSRDKTSRAAKAAGVFSSPPAADLLTVTCLATTGVFAVVGSMSLLALIRGWV